MQAQYMDKTIDILQCRILRNLADLKNPNKLPIKRRILTQDLYEKILHKARKRQAYVN